MRIRMKRLTVIVLALVALLVTNACSPSTAPTTTPTKAASTAPTVAPQAAATKPAASAAASPTVAEAKPTGTPINIGFLTPLTGVTSQSGQLQKIAQAMAEQDINNAGGINGSPVKTIMEDSACVPQQAVTMFRKLAQQDKVFVVLGPYCSGEFQVTAPLSNDLQVPDVATISTVPGIPAANRPWSFRVALTTDLILPTAVDAFKKKYPNVKRMVISGDTKTAVTEDAVHRMWPQVLKAAGYEIIDTVAFEAGTTDFSAIVTRIKDLKPDAIAFESMPMESVPFAKEFERQGLKIPAVTGTSFWVGPSVMQAGTAMNGWVTAPWFDATNPDPKVQQWVGRFMDIANADAAVVKPAVVTVEAHHYNTFMAVADIMRKAGIDGSTPLQDARTKTRDGLQALKDYPSLVGPITINANGDANWKPVAAMAQDGKWVVIK